MKSSGHFVVLSRAFFLTMVLSSFSVSYARAVEPNDALWAEYQKISSEWQVRRDQAVNLVPSWYVNLTPYQKSVADSAARRLLVCVYSALGCCPSGRIAIRVSTFFEDVETQIHEILESFRQEIDQAAFANAFSPEEVFTSLSTHLQTVETVRYKFKNFLNLKKNNFFKEFLSITGMSPDTPLNSQTDEGKYFHLVTLKLFQLCDDELFAVQTLQNSLDALSQDYRILVRDEEKKRLKRESLELRLSQREKMRKQFQENTSSDTNDMDPASFLKSAVQNLSEHDLNTLQKFINKNSDFRSMSFLSFRNVLMNISGVRYKSKKIGPLIHYEFLNPDGIRFFHYEMEKSTENSLSSPLLKEIRNDLLRVPDFKKRLEHYLGKRI